MENGMRRCNYKFMMFNIVVKFVMFDIVDFYPSISE